MAVEIGGNGKGVSLTGEDAVRFVDELRCPSNDVRRLEHLKRADEAPERDRFPEPISELPPSDK
jgi:hypothetical protein